MDKAYDFLLYETSIKDGDSLVVAVSGGPDSMALLHLITKIKEKVNLCIICAHVNHNMRFESDEEWILVKNFCDNNGIIFEGMKIESYQKENFHKQARNKRYNFFEKLIKKYDCKYLLTAHHGDDLIETVLMRIVRGSTLRGYSGFSESSNIGRYTILRPLIHTTKNEIYNYLEINNIEFAQDYSNEKDVYTRNRFRKYIVPQIKQEDPNVHNKFYKFSRTLIEYNNYIDNIVEQVINLVYSDHCLYVHEFSKQHPVIQNKIVYSILEKIYRDNLLLIEDAHAELILELIHSKKANSTISLPNKIRVVKIYNNVFFNKENVIIDEYNYELEKEVKLPNGRAIGFVEESDLTDNNVCRLSKNDINLPIYVRTRFKGDKIYVKNMSGSKKIKDIFIDEKIPIENRNMWPIVVDSNNNILWIPGLKKSKFDKSKNEKYDIIIRYY